MPVREDVYEADDYARRDAKGHEPESEGEFRGNPHSQEKHREYKPDDEAEAHHVYGEIGEHTCGETKHAILS